MKKVVTKKSSEAPAAGVSKTADADVKPEEPEPKVVCLRLLGKIEVSIYVAMDRYDGRNDICVSVCDHCCINGGKKKNGRKA